MRSYRVPKVCDPPRLADALVAAGVPLLTVRAERVKPGEPSMYAVVLTRDDAPPNTMALIAQHVETRIPSRIPTPQEMASAFADWEAKDRHACQERGESFEAFGG